MTVGRRQSKQPARCNPRLWRRETTWTGARSRAERARDGPPRSPRAAGLLGADSSLCPSRPPGGTAPATGLVGAVVVGGEEVLAEAHQV